MFHITDTGAINKSHTSGELFRKKIFCQVKRTSLVGRSMNYDPKSFARFVPVVNVALEEVLPVVAEPVVALIVLRGEGVHVLVEF